MANTESKISEPAGLSATGCSGPDRWIEQEWAEREAAAAAHRRAAEAAAAERNRQECLRYTWGPAASDEELADILGLDPGEDPTLHRLSYDEVERMRERSQDSLDEAAAYYASGQHASIE